MLASILVTTVALIALQVVLVIKLADWLSQDCRPVEGRNAVVLGSANGRFSGLVGSRLVRERHWAAVK